MQILASRRGFLTGALAVPLAGCLAPGGLLSSRANVKFGVLSDIHITDWNSTEIFRKALRHFRDEEVDAVMIVGDLADHGLLPQLENVAKAWYEVFPNDMTRDGRHVEKLFVTGNHDPEGLDYRDAAMDKAFAVHHLTYEEAEKLRMDRLGMAKCWEQCFHEKYQPIYRKNVRGYDFIGAHWDSWKGVAGLEDWFAQNIRNIDTGRPFFYFQHPTPRGTIYGADSWGDDDGMSTRALAPYPNAVAFSGHSHRPLTDKRSYWRGEFTSIGTSTLSYVCLPWKGRFGTPNYRNKLDCRQGQIVSVYDDRLVIVRRDFVNDEDLDEAVVLEMPAKPSSFSVRAVARRNIPEFAPGAEVKARNDGGDIVITFPGAFANETARPFEYRIDANFRWKDAEGKERNEWISSAFFQPMVAFSRKRAMAAGDVQFVWKRDRIPSDATSFELFVHPLNSYGGAGKPIYLVSSIDKG